MKPQGDPIPLNYIFSKNYGTHAQTTRACCKVFVRSWPDIRV